MAAMPLAYHGIAVYKTANHGIEPWLNLNNAASSGDVKKTQGCGGSWRDRCTPRFRKIWGRSSSRSAQQTRYLAIEEVMKSSMWTKPHENRRCFIGGSDARIIMGSDEAAPTVAREARRGRARAFVRQSHRAARGRHRGLNRSWSERNTGRQVRDVQRRVKHSAIPWMAATLDGIVEGTEAVFEAKFMLPWSFSEEAAAEK